MCFAILVLLAEYNGDKKLWKYFILESIFILKFSEGKMTNKKKLGKSNW